VRKGAKEGAERRRDGGSGGGCDGLRSGDMRVSGGMGGTFF